MIRAIECVASWSRPAVRPRASRTQGFVYKPTGRKAAGDGSRFSPV